jgi:hypothetical protein
MTGHIFAHATDQTATPNDQTDRSTLDEPPPCRDQHAGALRWWHRLRDIDIMVRDRAHDAG